MLYNNYKVTFNKNGQIKNDLNNRVENTINQDAYLIYC